MRPFCVKCLCLGWLPRTEGAEMPPFSQETSGPHRFIFAECIGKAAGGEKGCQRSGAARRLSLTCAWLPLPPTSRRWGCWYPQLCGLSVPPEEHRALHIPHVVKPIHPLPLSKPMFLLCALGDKFALHPRGKYSIFQGYLLYRHSCKDSLE